MSPDLKGETTVFLEPGVYTFTCMLRTEEGEFHMIKGMSRPFIVTDQESGAEKPKGSVDITLSDLAIDIEDSLEAGTHIFDVKFEASHNVHLAKLKQDQKLEDLERWMNTVQTPSPFIFLGGAEQAPVGMTSTFKANLEPGRYAFVTFPTAESGMSEEFIIPKKGKAPPVINKTVNPEVRIALDMEKAVLPEIIPIGRTPLVIKNRGSEEYRYFLAYLLPGKGAKDLNMSLRDGSRPPIEPIWSGDIKPGEIQEINLEVEEKTYVLIGPYLPGSNPQKGWREDNFVHLIKGVKESDQ